MIIGVDGASLRVPLTGIGRYAFELLAAMLPLLSPDERLVSMERSGVVPIDVAFLEAVNRANRRYGSEPPKETLWRAVGTILKANQGVRRAARLVRTLEFQRASSQIDLFHAVNYAAPGKITKPVLPIIYDLSHIRYPDTHPPERVEWLARNAPAWRQAPVIQVISEFTKKELIELLGIEPGRIHVAYPGIRRSFKPDKIDTDLLSLSRYGLKSKQYMLVVATQEPRKNFATVAQAYSSLPQKIRDQFPLVWIGASGWGDVTLPPDAQQAFRAGNIKRLGYVEDDVLPPLYRHAAFFLMPSLYEGFGMPLAEALACGTRALASCIPVFKEIASSNVAFIDPLEVEHWREQMLRWLQEGSCDVPVPGEIGRFSWEESARITLSLYRLLAKSETSNAIKQRLERRLRG